MKKLIIALSLIYLSGCGEDIKLDSAEKNGITFGNNLNPFSRIPKEANPGPDTVTAFVWPDENFYQQQINRTKTEQSDSGEKCTKILNGEGDAEETADLTPFCLRLKDKVALFLNTTDYTDYITEVSKRVNLNGKVFDDETRWLIEESPKIVEEIDKLKAEKRPFSKERRKVRRSASNANKKVKAEKTKLGKLQKSKEEKEEAKKIEEAALQESTTQSESKNCKDVLNGDQSHPDFQACTELKEAIANHQSNIEKLDAEILELSESITSQEAKVAKAEEEYKKLADRLTFVESEIERLSAEADALNDVIKGHSDLQSQALNGVQKALDPQAANDSERVNWIDTKDKDSNHSDVNYVRVFGKNAEIHFNKWGKNQITYKTKFKTKLNEETEEEEIQLDANGRAVLAADSDVVEIDFNSDQVLEFKIKEKDLNGHATGRMLEFKMQRSAFGGSLTLLLGDLTITRFGTVERRGQAKVMLTAKEELSEEE